MEEEEEDDDKSGGDENAFIKKINRKKVSVRSFIHFVTFYFHLS